MACLEEAKSQLEGIVKPFQQEQNSRQKKSDFLKKCITYIDKNNFFQLDELLRSKEASLLLEDPYFKDCEPILNNLQVNTNQQIDRYRLEFKDSLLRAAEELGLPLEINWPHFSVLKGIEGKIDFTNRKTVINQVTLKSIDPKRIVLAALKIKKRLYDIDFQPQVFINSLWECYQEILKKNKGGMGDPVPIWQLYKDYVWSLQSQSFLQNMDKGKFRGYPIDQFAVDLWRYFQSGISSAEGEYFIRLNSGRGGSLWLIDHTGQRRQITHVFFAKI